MKDKYKLYPGP